MSLVERIVLAALPMVPRPLMRRLAARYIAGETLDDALGKLDDLAAQGYGGILDILGEDVESEAEARGVLAAYTSAAEALASAGRDAYVSVKPTHFGLRISRELALELYRELAERCRELSLFVRVEMEDHTTTDWTLDLFARLFGEYRNTGIVLQSRLLRTPGDIDRLPDGPVDVRMVKGVYLEPETIAHTAAQPIRDAFVACTERLFARGHSVAIATHDDSLADRVLEMAAARGVSRSRYAFEVLLGVRSELWERWAAAGHRVRVYVPFGPEWRSYSQRRLKHNPEILRHVIRNTLSR